MACAVTSENLSKKEIAEKQSLFLLLMKLCVFGSRTLKDDRVKVEILEKIDELGADTIVTAQEPLGVCTVAQNVAKSCGLVLELHFLNFKYRKGAFKERSKECIRASDHVLIIHDGESQGTANELGYVKQLKKPYTYITMEKSDRSVNYSVDFKLPAFDSKSFIDDLEI